MHAPELVAVVKAADRYLNAWKAGVEARAKMFARDKPSEDERQNAVQAMDECNVALSDLETATENAKHLLTGR